MVSSDTQDIRVWSFLICKINGGHCNFCVAQKAEAADLLLRVTACWAPVGHLCNFSVVRKAEGGGAFTNTAILASRGGAEKSTLVGGVPGSCGRLAVVPEGKASSDHNPLHARNDAELSLWD